MVEKTRLKANGARTKKSSHRGRSGTDWGKLRRMSAATIRKGIVADPDAHATDEEFWKSARASCRRRKRL